MWRAADGLIGETLLLMASCSVSLHGDTETASFAGFSRTHVNLEDRYGDGEQFDDEDDVEFLQSGHTSVARHTASGIELLMLYLETEIRRVRFFLRDCGVRVRRFCADSLRIDIRRIARLFAALSDSQIKHVSMDLSELNRDEAMIFNAVPLRSRWRPPKYTFNDIAIVLTTDEEVEDGVVHAYTIRAPAWSRLPSPIMSRNSESDLKDFQFFNRPMKMTIPTDDDDDRISLPSTMATDHELKIQSLEAQLALLSKQMQSLLGGNLPVPPPAPAAPSSDVSPVLSDDEGKGPSLCSPANTVKSGVPPLNQGDARRCPPGAIPPAPPPPPPSLFSASSNTSTNRTGSPGKRTVLQMLNKSTTLEHEALPVRPSASDLRTVQLKKTNTLRSPGGTPVVRSSRLPATDEGNYLANALREKFRSLQENLSEHEDDVNSSWLEDDM